MEKRINPESIKSRTPLFKEEWLEVYIKMGGHPEAPRWNTECGDRITSDDMIFIKEFTSDLYNSRENFNQNPPDRIVQWIESRMEDTPWFREKIKPHQIRKNWHMIEPMNRADMQKNLELIVPENVCLDRLVINPTSGTTGHPIQAPNHPRAVGCYDPIIQYALERHGVKENYGCGKVAAIQICSQKKTITYHAVHSYLDGAGFAKVNLEPENWQSPVGAEIYINDMKPVFLSGDPFSFIEYMRHGISYRPRAVLTTAVALEKNLRLKMEEYFKCPIVDMYSLNETGPIAYSCPADPSRFHILPHDIFTEIISPDGRQLNEGETGLIAVSGGRNPYLPLLRYVTGDSGALSFQKCLCGEKTPSLYNLQGRGLVLYRTPSGKIINSIDISGIIREFPVYAFQFIQQSDFKCRLSVAAGADLTLTGENYLIEKIGTLFQREVEILIDRNLKSGERKNIPFISDTGINI